MIVLIAVFATLPLLQVGLSYWASFPVIAAFLLIVHFNKKFLGALASDYRAKLLAVTCMYMSLPFTMVPFDFHDLLMISREVLFFVLLASALALVQRVDFGRNARAIAMGNLAGLSAVLVFIFVQRFVPQLELVFHIPKELFAANANTVSSQQELLDALLHQWTTRPKGTFGEPSYCALYFLSLIVMYQGYIKVSDLKVKPLALAILGLSMVGGVLLESLYFFAAVGIYLSAIYVVDAFHTGLRKLILPATLVIIAVIVALAMGLFDEIFDRLSVLTSGQADASTMVRLVIPAALLAPYMATHPFGSPASALGVALAPYSSYYGIPADLIGSGIFGMFLAYGLTAFLLYGVILRSCPDWRIRLYILLTASQNGVVFAPDKFVLICVTVIVYEMARRSSVVDRSLNNSVDAGMMPAWGASPHLR